MALADKLAPRQPKVLTVDIETSPAVAFVWKLFDTTIAPSQVIEPSRVLCFAAKWYHQKRVLFGSEYHDGREAFLDYAWRLFDEADAVVTYNGVRFDVPHLQREWVLQGWGPPSPWQDIDWWHEVIGIARRNKGKPTVAGMLIRQFVKEHPKGRL